ncbi:MAG TPA: hypothetical protein VG722_02135, partial [Tepidisphaeraceae bacterium]|nr:hypothetical protein [Tepidisphaeraceae bacterium]
MARWKQGILVTVLAAMNLAAAPASQPVAKTPWDILKEAGQLPMVDSPTSSSLTYKPYPPYSKKWWALARNSEEKNKRQFELLRQSRLLMQSDGGHSGIPVPDKWFCPTAEALTSQLGPMRHLADIESDAVIVSHLDGNDGEVVRRLLDELNIADCIRQGNWMGGELVAVGIDDLACQTIQVI